MEVVSTLINDSVDMNAFIGDVVCIANSYIVILYRMHGGKLLAAGNRRWRNLANDHKINYPTSNFPQLNFMLQIDLE